MEGGHDVLGAADGVDSAADIAEIDDVVEGPVWGVQVDAGRAGHDSVTLFLSRG